MRSSVCCFYRPVQHLFVSLDLSPGNQARRIRRARCEKNVHQQVIHAERGMILDANNEVLAHNIPVETVVADATHLSDVQATVDLLNTELEIPSQELTEKLNSGRRYIVIKREVPTARANALREKLRAGNLRGIYLRARRHAHLPQRLDALPRDWVYRFRSPRRPGG